jgi:hypothetical protein
MNKGNLSVPWSAQPQMNHNLTVETKQMVKAVDANSMLFPQSAGAVPYGTLPLNLLGTSQNNSILN